MDSRIFYHYQHFFIVLGVKYLIFMISGILLLSLYGVHKKFGSLYSLPWVVLMVVLTYLVIKGFNSASFFGPGSSIFTVWSNGIGVPQSFDGCDARVAAEQTDLFTPRVYEAQFSRRLKENVGQSIDDFHRFHARTFESIRQNSTLCSRGFEANTDLYGLGIRSGIYLQWISALLLNNLLSSTKIEVQKLYLAFSLAVSLATSVASFAQTCTFAIEIEVLYWMYWGGYVTVFGTAPCPIRMVGRIQWAKLQWTSTIIYLTHMAMTYHGIWYAWHAYDRSFA